MLRLCLALRSASVQRKPHLFRIDLTSKHTPGHLYLADRAVKSTAADPCFVCLDNAMACQTVDSNAAVVLRSCMTKGRELFQYGRMRFQGMSAALVFRHNHLVFQGIGDASVQALEMSLQHKDIFALLGGISQHENIPEWARAVEKAIAEGDVEYVAEEMLLQLRCSTEGCTSVVAKISKFSAGLPEPPSYSHAM
ncbi:hypothetical protein, conserved [Leishmania donovani]|uniref:Uncharacterized protein n=1 Tax=Leishmania donovani TaxID=5661 RepID=A0A3S7XBG2_LEIDO|nr:hypothetical protein, conserved [Leishmania donovani]AYU83744.1 hypothetical protein LdCL_360045900 [Leishmania donovani]TPP48495.1 hypothetical protein CGC21_14225 [Leishmania donovani]CBZ38826.1 hypothetical protein, conserved [Leishmania donovani]